MYADDHMYIYREREREHGSVKVCEKDIVFQALDTSELVFENSCRTTMHERIHCGS